jgi:hypothetical protein
MPVRKFRSIEEMKQPRWLDAGDPSIGGKFRYLWSLAGALNQVRAPRGVHKYRSIEEADANREAREREGIARLLATDR